MKQNFPLLTKPFQKIAYNSSGQLFKHYKIIFKETMKKRYIKKNLQSKCIQTHCCNKVVVLLATLVKMLMSSLP